MIGQYIKPKNLISGYTVIFIFIIISVSYSGYRNFVNSEDDTGIYEIQVDDENSYMSRRMILKRGRLLHLGFIVNDAINFTMILDDNYQQILNKHTIDSDRVIEFKAPITGQWSFNITSEYKTDVKMVFERSGFPSIIFEINFICLTGIVLSILYNFIKSYFKITNRTKVVKQLDTPSSSLIKSKTELSLIQQFRLSHRYNTYFPIGLLFIVFFPSPLSYGDFESHYFSSPTYISIEYSFLNNFLLHGSIRNMLVLHTIGVTIILLPSLVNRFRGVTYTENIYGIDPIISKISQFLYVEGIFSFIFFFPRVFRFYDAFANGRPYQFPVLSIILSLLIFTYFTCFTIVILTIVGITKNELIPIIISIMLFSYPSFVSYQNSSIKFMRTYNMLLHHGFELDEFFSKIALRIIFYFFTSIIVAMTLLYLHSRHFMKRRKLFKS